MVTLIGIIRPQIKLMNRGGYFRCASGGGFTRSPPELLSVDLHRPITRALERAGIVGVDHAMQVVDNAPIERQPRVPERPPA